jgi:[NiFe] hydrogenase diaphorase moiety large subunit
MTIGKTRISRTRLLDKLWIYQLEKGYISDSDIRKISKELHISIVEINGVISFYHFFHRIPTGHFTIYLNNSIVAKMNGYEEVKNAFEKETGASIGKVDPTGTFGLFETSCIGLSDQEPAALINFRPFTNLNSKKVKEIIQALKAKENIDNIADEVIDHIQHTLGERSVFFTTYKRGIILKKALKLKPADIVEEIKWSGLSGRGGAFFPTGLKWDICRKGMSFQKYVICNADEGEPGTFKDRLLLTNNIGTMLEGMIIGGYAIGASQGFIYLRAEYYYLKAKIEREIKIFHERGLLGEGILGRYDFDFDIKVQMGAGSYVCGEETALIESLEGKRGEPRTRTFFPGTKGFMYQPTLVNNVETFCAAARIMQMGAEVFKQMGTAFSTGSKLFSVSGDCDKPGIYELEWGMKVSDLLLLCGAKDTQFVQWSGPSGTLLSKDEFNNEINNEDMLCGGAVTIFNESRDLLQVMANFNQFFIDESCGLCTPCRAGNYLSGKRIERIMEGKGRETDFADLMKWGDIIKNTSRCGLGKTSTNFILDAFKKFPMKMQSYIYDMDSMEKEFNIEDYVLDYSTYVNKMNSDG